MKKYLTALYFGLLYITASAQIVELQKSILCTTPEKMFQELSKNYKERIYWAGGTSSSVYMLWVNAEANTWTLTQSTAEISCIIGSGQDNRFLLGNTL